MVWYINSLRKNNKHYIMYLWKINKMGSKLCIIGAINVKSNDIKEIRGCLRLKRKSLFK